jgi:hypothetical protein
MAASCSVHMVIAGIPAARGQVDPALELESLGTRRGAVRRLRNCDLLMQNPVFRTARVSDVIRSRRQAERFAVGSINLVVKKEVVPQPARTGRVNAVAPVANDELGRRRSAVVVDDFQRHVDRRLALKQQIHLAVEAQVLRALADVERELRLSRTAVATE